MALQFHNKVIHTFNYMNYKYSHSLRNEIEIDISSYQFYRRFSIRYLLFCFFQAKFSRNMSSKGLILYGTQTIDNMSRFLRVSTFYSQQIYLLHLVTTIQFNYFILNVIIFLFNSRQLCFALLFDQMNYPSTKALNLFFSTSQILLPSIF